MFQQDWRTLMNESVAPEIDKQLGGERLTFVPCTKKPNVPAVPDWSKAKAICGIFDLQFKLVLTATNNPVESRDPCARVGYYQLDLLGFAPKGGDWIRREDTGHLYEIRKVMPDGVSMTEFELTELGRQAGSK